MPVLIARLNLRRNWSIVLSLGLIIPLLFAVLKINSAWPYHVPNYAPSPGTAVDYEELISNYNGFPIIYLALIFAVMVLAICVAIWKPRPNWVKLCVALFSIGTCLIASAVWLQVTGADGTTFAHVSTLKFNNVTYHLARAHTLDIGLTWDKFWVFKCDRDYRGCHYNDIQTEKISPYVSGDQPTPDARLIADELTNTLYVQIGDEKTLIAQ